MHIYPTVTLSMTNYVMNAWYKNITKIYVNVNLLTKQHNLHNYVQSNTYMKVTDVKDSLWSR